MSLLIQKIFSILDVNFVFFTFKFFIFLSSVFYIRFLLFSTIVWSIPDLKLFILLVVLATFVSETQLVKSFSRFLPSFFIRFRLSLVTPLLLLNDSCNKVGCYFCLVGSWLGTKGIFTSSPFRSCPAMFWISSLRFLFQPYDVTIFSNMPFVYSFMQFRRDVILYVILFILCVMSFSLLERCSFGWFYLFIYVIFVGNKWLSSLSKWLFNLS